MRSCQHPLVGNQHAGTVEYLARTTENGGDERPVARRRNGAANDAAALLAQMLGADPTAF